MNSKKIKRKFNNLQRKILYKNDWRLSIDFCINSNNHNNNINLLKIKEHEDIIYNVEKDKIKHIRYTYIHNIIEFVRYVKHADINKVEELVLNNYDPQIIHCFAHLVNQSNKEKLFRKLLELNDLEYINYFLKNIDFDKEKYKDLLLFI